MTISITAGQCATVSLDPFASLTLVVTGRATLAFTSAAKDLHPDLPINSAQSRTYGPYGVPMTVVITAVDQAMTYLINGNTGGFAYDASGNVIGLMGPDDEAIPTVDGNLTAVAGMDEVPNLAGFGGPMNLQAQALLNRSADLDARVNALQLADYTVLRAYAGAMKAVYVTGYLASAAPSGIAGLFTVDDSDTTSADNGGTIIVASNGKRWKRAFTGAGQFSWFGTDTTGLVDTTVRVQAALDWARDAKAVLEGNAQDRFLISATVTVSFPAQVDMHGGRFVTAPVFTGTEALRLRNVTGNPTDTKKMVLGLQGPYGGPAYSMPPNIAMGTYNTLDGIDIDGSANQINNVDLHLWVEGFRDNVIVKGSHWWLHRFRSIHCGKFWRRGISFSRITDAGEMIYFDGGVMFNGVNSDGTAIAVYEDGTANVDATFTGMSLDYCDTFVDVASGLWRFVGGHWENNNNVPQARIRYTPGQSRTRLAMVQCAPAGGPGGSGHLAAEVATGRVAMIETYDSVSVDIAGQLASYGKPDTQLVKNMSGTPVAIKAQGWVDTIQAARQPVPYLGHNALYNGAFELGTLAGWTTGSGWSVDSVSPDEGVYSAKNVASGATYFMQQKLSTSPDDTWLVSTRARGNSMVITGGGGLKLRVQFLASDGVTVISDDLTSAGNINTDSASFAWLGAKYIAPKGAAFIVPTLYVQNVTGTAWFDQAQAYRIR